MTHRANEDKSLKHKPANSSFECKISRARRVVAIEQIWPRLWLPIGIAILFVLVSTFGLWPALPLPLHMIVLALFAAAGLVSLVPLLKIRRANRAQAIRWLEKKSGLAHRPATVLEDNLSNHAPAPSDALWHAHKKRAKDLVKTMKTGLPRPQTARFDRHALRVPLMLALAATIGLQAQRLKPGLFEAFSFYKADDFNNLRIDAWVTPPLYTGNPPVILVDGSKPISDDHADQDPLKLIKLPELSEIVIHVSGPNSQKTNLVLQQPPAIKGDATPSELPKITSKQEDSVYELRAKLANTVLARLQLNGRTIKNWQFTIGKDTPPTIAFTKQPNASMRGSLRISYRISDDYGVIEAKAHITKSLKRRDRFGKETSDIAAPSSPAPDNLIVPLGTPPTFPLLLPKGKSKKGETSTYKDLVSHPWAGLYSEMVLTAHDEAGKTGKSVIARFKLPERKFIKPLAQRIIAQRRTLVESPIQRKAVAGILNQLTKRNINSRNPDLDNRTYLALRSVYWRLQGANTRAIIRSAVDQLWEIALTIEDGNLSRAERELRSAQDKLMDALANNASPKEIAKLMKELRQALSKFLQAMAKQENQQQQQADQQQTPGDQKTLTSKELDQMLRDIENMAKTGARDAAKQMLSQLREMLESLQNNQPKASAQAQKSRKQLDQLGKMIMQQQRLLDETHRQSQQGRQEGRQGERQDRGDGQRQGRRRGHSDSQSPGRKPGGQTGGAGDQMQRAGASELKRRQGKLLDGLNDLMDQMGSAGSKIPQDLMRAGSNMGQAESQLGREQMNRAGQQQGKALSNLRKGAAEMAEQMQRNGQGQGQRQGRGNRDPLGRAQPTEFGADDDVKIPGKIDTRRTRDILEELRRRLGQSTRPPAELDYLERLIKQF
ncbi:MAG: TIGR02302 family protein [bacterium]|nr:TIGR02302 family protein [bacterium]